MLASLVAGAAAGYGVAIPVGAIAVLIVETGVRRGFAAAFAAGLGTASADAVYSSVAVVLGAAASAVAAPVLVPFRAAAALVLGALGVRTLLRARAPDARAADERGRRSPLRTYARFLGLTLLNPLTVVYFAAFALGTTVIAADSAARAAFVVGVVLASASWQTVLAATGALLRRHVSSGLRSATSVVGGLIVLALAVRIGVDALAR